jgi:uncharacterized protein (TIGR03437 family)
VAGIGPACAFSSNTCTGSFSGDGGPATSAALNFPEGLTVDGSGNLYIGDTGNLRVRRVSASGIITTIAGDGIFDYNIFDPAGDGGPATAAELNLPEGVFVDASGNIFISDNLRGRVREVFGSASPPSVPATGVTDGAGFAAKIAAGGIASIFGTNLAASTASAAAVPLARTLSGTTVTMNGMAVPLFFVSASQINFQVPWELQPSPTANLTVTTAAGTSPPITVSLYSAAPGIFTINTTNSATQGAIQIANSTTFVAPVGALPGNTSRPAVAGDVLTIFCSGLGAVTNTPASGSAAGSGR